MESYWIKLEEKGDSGSVQAKLPFVLIIHGEKEGRGPSEIPISFPHA